MEVYQNKALKSGVTAAANSLGKSAVQFKDNRVRTVMQLKTVADSSKPIQMMGFGRIGNMFLRNRNLWGGMYRNFGSKKIGGSKDPAHTHWENLKQGKWNWRRFLNEGGSGMKGYLKSHFVKPPDEPISEVLADPARLKWHNDLLHHRNNKLAPEYLMEQWMSQNNAQARAGNPLPRTAGRIMLAGARRIGNAKNFSDMYKGYMHAQYGSIGRKGFLGGASYLLHGMAPFVQLPGMMMRGMLFGVPSVTKSSTYPVRAITRGIGSKIFK